MELIIIPTLISVDQRVRQMRFKCILNIIFMLFSILNVYHNIFHMYCFMMDYKYK